MVKGLSRRIVALSGDKQVRWQREQNARKNKKNKLVIGYWLLGIGLLVFGVLAVKGWQMFQGSRWDGVSRINFVLANDQVSLVSVDPIAQELIILAIPQGTQIEVTHGYGKYRVEVVGKLEEQEKRRGLLAESLQENLGIPVDVWLNTEYRIQNTEYNKNELLRELRKQILTQGKTNLSKWDLIRLWWQARLIRFDRVKFIDLSKISVLLSVTLPDQTQVWQIEPKSLDNQLESFFSDLKIREENLAIEILNGTDHPGLAEKGARILTNIGTEVISVGNSEVGSAPAEQGLASPEKCKVQSAKDKKESYTVEKIVKIWDCDWEEKKEEGRAEITLIVGEDYWQKLTQK